MGQEQRDIKLADRLHLISFLEDEACCYSLIRLAEWTEDHFGVVFVNRDEGVEACFKDLRLVHHEIGLALAG